MNSSYDTYLELPLPLTVLDHVNYMIRHNIYADLCPVWEDIQYGVIPTCKKYDIKVWVNWELLCANLGIDPLLGGL